MVRIEVNSAVPTEMAKCGDMQAGKDNSSDFMGMLFTAMLSGQQIPEMSVPLANMTLSSGESNVAGGTMNNNMASLLACMMPTQMMPGDMLQNNSEALAAPAGIGPGLLMQNSNTGNLLLENLLAGGNLIPQTAAVQSVVADTMQLVNLMNKTQIGIRNGMVPESNSASMQAMTGVSNGTAPAAGSIPQPAGVAVNGVVSPAAELIAVANQVLPAAAATDEQPKVVPQMQLKQAGVYTQEVSTDSCNGMKPPFVIGVLANDGGQKKQQGGLNQHTSQGVTPSVNVNPMHEIANSGSAGGNRTQDVVNGSMSKSWGETMPGDQLVATQQGHQVIDLGSIQVKQAPQAILGSVIQMANYRDNDAGPVSTSIKLKLEPKNLGEMTVKLSFSKGELTAHFYTSSTMAKDAVEGTLPQLKQLLTQHNIQLNDAAAFVGQDNSQQSGQGRYQQNNANYRFFADNDEGAAFSELMPQINKDDGGGLNWLV